MLGGVHTLDCCAHWQLHEDVHLNVGLCIGHHKVNRPHGPTHQQGHDENAPYCCPRYHRGKCGPVSVTRHLTMAAGAQTGLQLQDFSRRVAFAPKGPYHGNGLGILRDLGLVDDRIPSTTLGAEPPRDARDSGSARSHSTHLETSSSDRPKNGHLHRASDGIKQYVR